MSTQMRKAPDDIGGTPKIQPCPLQDPKDPSAKKNEHHPSNAPAQFTAST
jgi:hypothetical protein